jgi:hypothetical protein
MSTGLHVKYPYYFKISIELEISRQISEKHLHMKLMKIRPVKAELFHADRRTNGQTGMTNLLVAFRNVANAPKNGEKSRLKKTTRLIKYSVFRI